jgi:hypothetical protein
MLYYLNLPNLSTTSHFVLGHLGCHEEGLNASWETVVLNHQLDHDHPEVFTYELARSLNHLTLFEAPEPSRRGP